MRKVLFIIQREYISRVKTKAFLLSVLLVPFGMALLILVPILATMNVENESAEVLVYDPEQKIFSFLEAENDSLIVFKNSPVDYTQKEKNASLKTGQVALEFNSISVDSSRIHPKMRSSGKLSMQISENIREKVIRAVESYKLKQAGFARNPLDFKVDPVVESSAEVASLFGYILSMLNYILIAVYGAMMMRAVVEEKTSRIVEVILSSVKPFQLMLGKLIGICAVGLTQFFLWILLSFITTAALGPFISGMGQDPIQSSSVHLNPMNDPAIAAMQGKQETMISTILQIATPGFLATFVFYFLGGFFLYASLFAAVGSAVDQEQDAQQLTWPVMIPLILPLLLIGNVMQNPNGSLAVFLSIFPFSSSTIMMIRMAAGEPPFWQILLSMALLVGTILLCVWVAARIYRTGILLYGKKVTFREMIKWVVRS